MVRAARYLEQALGAEPLGIVEAGSRLRAKDLSAQEPYYRLDKKRVLGFEPEEAAYARLQAIGAPDVRFLPYALGREDGVATLYVTRDPKCSSLYEPNAPLLESFTGLAVAALDHKTTTPLRRLDTVLETEARWAAVDLLKADVQGAELDILIGAGRYLDDMLALVLEVEFAAIYRGQPLFCDVTAFLADRGFVFHHFLQLGGAFRNERTEGPRQVLWGDALYVRAPESVARSRCAHYAILTSLYGCHDLAVDALRRQPAAEPILTAYADLLKPRRGTRLVSGARALGTRLARRLRVRGGRR